MPTDYITRVRDLEPRARTTAPATNADIAAVERAVDIPFPDDVRALYRQTNGILDESFGPVLPLTLPPAAPFADAHGHDATEAGFPAYSLVQHTLMNRDPDFADGNGWGADELALFGTFVVLGVDVGGDMFGFFAGCASDKVVIRYVEHDTAEVGDEAWTLDEYLRFFFAEAAWFTE